MITDKPTCPACGYEMTSEDMLASGNDLFAIAPNEEETSIQCPSCDETYLCQGSYIACYESSLVTE